LKKNRNTILDPSLPPDSIPLKSSDSAQLPHFNRQPKKYDYRSYYDSDDFSVVEELYTDDVVIFEYKEERRRLLEFLTSQE